jgi:tRNA dimethylallyltransferase
LLDELGPEALHGRLAVLDPATAAIIRPSDAQRIARAWEVLRSTGIPLATWQSHPAPPPADAFRLILLEPPRAVLRAAIAGRFAAMLGLGAIEEVQSLLAQNLDPALPAMRAHGVPELAAFLRGEQSLAEAERRAVMATGQYTKRQATWFRNRAPVPSEDTHMIHARFAGPKQFSEREWTVIESFIRRGANPGVGGSTP